MSGKDGDALLQIDQDPEVMRHINGGRITTKREMRDVFLPRLAAYRCEKQGWGLWSSVRKDTAEVIGWTLVRPLHFFTADRDDRNLELGWRYKRSAWGQGYATEAALAICRALKQQTDVRAFSAITEEDNHASIKVMKKLGMQFVKKGLYRDPLGNHEVLYYSILLGNSGSE